MSQSWEENISVPITSIGVPTFNRPAALQRCVASFARNMQKHGRKTHVVVTDDAGIASLQEANQASLRSVRKHYPEFEFRYAGIAEKTHFAEALAQRSNIDPQIIEFMLFNPENLDCTTGANQNALFLQTVGECFLSVDEDVICRLSASANRDDQYKVTSTYDPTRVRVFSDRDALLSERVPEERDFLELHESVLGKKPKAIFKQTPEKAIIFEDPNSDLLNGMEKEARIRISWTGIYGDSGAENPGYYLWKDKYIREQLIESEEAYKRLSVSREILRAPDVLTIANGGYCQSTVLAYDQRSILPPFMPVQRGADIIFGKTLMACSETSLIGYLPWAVFHAPPEARSNNAEDIAKAGCITRFNQILPTLIENFPRSEVPHEDAEVLQKLGRYLCELSSLAVHEFEEIIHVQLGKTLTRNIEYFSDHLAGASDAPRKWSEDLRSLIKTLEGKLKPSIMRQSILIRGRNRDSYSLDESLALVQRLTHRFGQLLMAWPALFSATKDLKLCGIELAPFLSETN